MEEHMSMEDQAAFELINSEVEREMMYESNMMPPRLPLGHSTLKAGEAEEGSQQQVTPKRPRLGDSLNESGLDAVPGSPWEWRKMQGEVITLKTRIAHQQGTIQQLHKVRQEIDEVFRKEKRLLEIQVEQHKEAAKLLEKRVDVGRRRLLDAQNAHSQAQQDISSLRSELERQILSLMEDRAKLRTELQECRAREANPAPTLQDPEDPNLLKLERQSERIAQLEEKLREAMAEREQYELQRVELQALKLRLEAMQADSQLVEEGKKFVYRAGKAQELELDLEEAKRTIDSLREAVKGKLLMEEQMATAELRLKGMEALERELASLEVEKGELACKLGEWEALGVAGDPRGLRREVNRLQRAELVLTAEGGELRAKIEALEREVAASRQEQEDSKKLLADSSNSHERLTRFIGRLQKKLSLVTKERDALQEQRGAAGAASQPQEGATPAPDKTAALLENYREMVKKLEADLEYLEGGEQRLECKRLQAELDGLKRQLEHRALKGDFDLNTRILHYKLNPAALAAREAEQRRKDLLMEVEQLRAIVSHGPGFDASAAAAAGGSSLQAKEIEELKQTNELKITRLKEAFKASSSEFRQACYQLFGWKLDRTKEGHYKLSSQYAESPDDYLFFIVNEEGVNMIETPFSATVSLLIERHLTQQRSVPMFLNAVQSDLFDQQTMVTVTSN